MKRFLLLIAIATTLTNTAFALSEKSDWSEIRKNRKINIVQPKFAEALGPKGLFNACSNVTEIRSINPVGICLDYKNVTVGIPNTEIGAYTKRVCTKSEAGDVIISKTHNQTVCLRHAPPTETSSNECIEWGNKTIVYPDTYSLEVVRAEKLEAGNHLFNKTLVLPACE